MRIAFAAIFILAMLAFCLTGCATTGTAGATTQPSVDMTSQVVALAANTALSDYQAFVAAGILKPDPTIDAAVAACQAALSDLSMALPGTPQYQTYLKAANDAAVTLAIQLAKAKATKASSRADEPLNPARLATLWRPMQVAPVMGAWIETRPC